MSEVARIQGSILATWALAVIAVCLRFLARRLSKAGLWYDDWLIVPATVSILSEGPDCHWESAQAHTKHSSSPRRYAWLARSGVGDPNCTSSRTMDVYELTSDCHAIVTKQGLGQDIEFLTPYTILSLSKTIVISEICWGVVIWIVEYSILALYWRLFSTHQRLIRVIIWVLTALVTCWGIAVVRSRPTLFGGVFYQNKMCGLLMMLQVLMTLLRCVPVNSLWDPTVPSHCYISDSQYFLESSISHIAIDVLLLGLPMPLIWRLHMHRSHITTLTVIFALGSLYVALFFMSPPQVRSALDVKERLSNWVCSLTSVLNPAGQWLLLFA